MTAARLVRASFRLKDCVVPKVKGKKLRAAKLAIVDHGCRVGRVQHAFSDRVKKGQVMRQKPKPHKRASTVPRSAWSSVGARSTSDEQGALQWIDQRAAETRMVERRSPRSSVDRAVVS
jgi:hypothetical protein